MLYFYIFIFLIGLSVGSFFNVIIFRFGRPAPERPSSDIDVPLSPVPNKTKNGSTHHQLRHWGGHWGGRSKCLNCNSIIRWFDLIPVLSYFVLKGRCRKCNIKISPLYPVVEISTATVLLLLFLNTPVVSYLTALNAFIILLLILVTFFDIRYLIIPDKILLLIAAGIVILKLNLHMTDFYWLLITAFGLTSFFAILYVVSKGKWMGFGDIKFIFLMGFLLGYPMGYLAIVTAIWLAAIFSIILLVQKKATAKTEIPFGSFLSASTIIFIIFSNELQKISRYFY